MIPVTKTFVPPFEEYSSLVKKAFDNAWFTNRGPLCLDLEAKLKTYLDVSFITIMTNGTLPIQIAVKLLGKAGEIITTPFSYVATTSSIVWENCTPVFVDIDETYLTIDETKIEAAITLKTTAILATHVFGNPCNIEAIEQIAKKHNLHVIYDAAHCFDVKYNGKSVFNYGDVSTCSFHATKLFHTGEGGAAFCNNAELANQIFYSHNFGHNGPTDFQGVGINGKISELQAAMGLSVLPYMEKIKEERKKVVDFYLQNLDWNNLSTIKIRENTDWNYSYFPVIFKNEAVLLKVIEKLNANKVFPRRYFYPSLNNLVYINNQKAPVSEFVAKRVLCLPLYVGIETEVLEEIVNTINEIVI